MPTEATCSRYTRHTELTPACIPTGSRSVRNVAALKELLDKLEETSGTDASFALAWGEYTRADDQGAREAALDRALQDYLSRTDRASEPHHFLSDLTNYLRPIGGWSRSAPSGR